ncbi:MAG: hypothetical protein L3V56_06360 [Candidatus Magnetoovum sp. WYHC-5]|nr:hypothetical protein [Candidatus Magnetoovum sp. WYHC-5]
MKKDDLKEYTGKDGKPAYIAYKGKVYDVSKSKLWANGIHMANHKAGQDLTANIVMAPHGEDVLKRVTLVGELEDKEPDLQIPPDIQLQVNIKEKYRQLYKKFHPHPVLIHNPMGLFVFSALMQAIYILSKDVSFERAAFYSTIFATLTTFPAILSGLFSWWVNYETTFTKIFKAKIIFSAILCVTSIIVCLLRTLIPNIYIEEGLLNIIYNSLIFLNVGFISYVAYNGGKITWPS